MGRRAFVAAGAALVAAGVVRPLFALFPRSPDPARQQAPTLRDPSIVQQRAPTVAGDNDLAVQELEKRLKCTCGCNLDVFTCRTTDFTCQTSPAMHRDVLARLAGGSTPDEVVASFVAQYGEQVLMQPPKQGFNWTAYIMPFVGLGVGLGLLAMLMRRWIRIGGAEAQERGATDGPPVPRSPGPALSAEDDERLKRELERFEA